MRLIRITCQPRLKFSSARTFVFGDQAQGGGATSPSPNAIGRAWIRQRSAAILIPSIDPERKAAIDGSECSVRRAVRRASIDWLGTRPRACARARPLHARASELRQQPHDAHPGPDFSMLGQ